jgi:hypothetical protein
LSKNYFHTIETDVSKQIFLNRSAERFFEKRASEFGYHAIADNVL